MQKQHNSTRQIWKSWTALCTVTFRGDCFYIQRKNKREKEANMKWNPDKANQVPQAIPNSYSVHICTHTQTTEHI